MSDKNWKEVRELENYVLDNIDKIRIGADNLGIYDDSKTRHFIDNGSTSFSYIVNTTVGFFDIGGFGFMINFLKPSV